ncbi:MAG: cytochrome c [Myxococcaceae bacterium]|jgi:mono/diheme cytochrome c family protein|nr:cytochrome c [Myxococcaceae bacterium]
MPRLVLALSLLTLAMSCGPSPEVEAINALTGVAATGQPLYATNCQTCHGADGKSGTTMRNVAATAKSNPTRLISIVVIGGFSMPSFSGRLSNQEVADILAHAKSL